MSKKILLSAVVGIAAISAGSALANTADQNSNAGIYVGAQLGYGDTNWKDLDNTISVEGSSSTGANGFATLAPIYSLNFKGTGLAGGAYAGYDFNQYLALEAGYTYFPNTKINFDGTKIETLKTYGIDVVGKITVPVVNGFGLFAKAGPGYLHTSSDHDLINNAHNTDLVYGFGANYQFNQHLIADVSFTRFNGDQKLDNKGYQPNADLYAASVAYKFNI